MPRHLLMGPQRPEAMLAEAFNGRGLPDGPVAVISAGWQEAEGDMDDIRSLLPGPLVDLELYQRAEALFARDPSLFAAYRERQDRLVELQRLYRLRLRQALLAVRQVRRSRAPADLAAGEERHAISQLRALDRHHLRRTQAVFDEFEYAGAVSGSVDECREAIERAIADCETVIVTGGHVLVLLNRLKLFGLAPLLQSRHLVAWSAGAMVLSDRVVLFHDETPQGRRDPELLAAGLGVIPGFVFLPDARRRLRQKDAVRIGVLNRRFSPARCVTLNSGALLHLDDGAVREARNIGYLSARGTIRELGTR